MTSEGRGPHTAIEQEVKVGCGAKTGKDVQAAHEQEAKDSHESSLDKCELLGENEHRMHNHGQKGGSTSLISQEPPALMALNAKAPMAMSTMA